MQFYSYLYLREDWTPYYAGKGSGKRVFARQHHYAKPPKDKTRILVFLKSSEAEAFASEIALIAAFGRKDNGTGCLRNLTDGGDGLSGAKHSEETRRKIRNSQMGHSVSPGARHKISEALKGNTHFLGRMHSEETRRKLSDATMGNTRRLGSIYSADARRKMSESVKKSWQRRAL